MTYCIKKNKRTHFSDIWGFLLPNTLRSLSSKKLFVYPKPHYHGQWELGCSISLLFFFLLNLLFNWKPLDLAGWGSKMENFEHPAPLSPSLCFQSCCPWLVPDMLFLLPCRKAPPAFSCLPFSPCHRQQPGQTTHKLVWETSFSSFLSRISWPPKLTLFINF